MKTYLKPLLIISALVLTALGVGQSLGQGNATPAGAGTASTGGRVGVIDLFRVFNECQQILDLNEIIKQKTEEYGKEAEQRRKVIEGKQTELSAFQPGTTDYEARRSDLIKLNIEANVWLKMMEQTIEQDRFNWTRIIYEKAVEAVGNIAKERGFDIVMQRADFKPLEMPEPTLQNLRRMIQERTTVYNVPDIDVTTAVIRRLDESYQAGGGKKQLMPRPSSIVPPAKP